jgi:hypothetical protein
MGPQQFEPCGNAPCLIPFTEPDGLRRRIRSRTELIASDTSPLIRGWLHTSSLRDPDAANHFRLLCLLHRVPANTVCNRRVSSSRFVAI